jgi:tetratricopeptide (TPR) repeat protein
MKAVFFVILCCFLVTATKSYSNSVDNLSDSLHHVIQTQTSHHQMDALLSLIRQNKKKLGENYIPLLKQYAQRAQHITYAKGEMKSYDFIGLEYRYQENFDTAYMYHNKSLEMAIRQKDSTQMFYNYNNLGQVFRKQDITAVAIDYFHKALKISNAVGNLKSSSYTMNTLGTTHILQKDYDRAMNYFKQSSEIARQRNDKRTLAYNYGSMGEVFLIEEDVDSAMYYFKTSRDLLVETGSDKGMGVAEHLIGKAYLVKEDYENAKRQFELALTYHQKGEDIRYQAYCNGYLGKIAIAEKEYEAADAYLNLAITQANKVNSLSNLMEAYTCYAELFKQLNRWEDAYKALEQSHFYAGRILNENSNKTIQALEIGFETKQKEQKIELLAAENHLKNQRLRVGFIFLAVLLVIIVLITYISNILRKQAILKQNNLQQQVLRVQMNPHFIFNVLGSIQNYMLGNEPQKASRYLSQFASLTRATLEYSTEDTITLNNEIAMLQNYMELEQMRTPDKFQFEIIYDQDLETDFIKIPPMLVQPFIENAIKHGFKTIDYLGKLTIRVRDKVEFVEFVIEDNGVGRQGKTNNEKQHRSMAMEIFKKRRKLIEQKHKKDFKFEILNLNDINPALTGMKICIDIPILNHD